MKKKQLVHPISYRNGGLKGMIYYYYIIFGVMIPVHRTVCMGYKRRRRRRRRKEERSC